jgi:[NiFe] hydrogenase diaphorase moiety large subunit
LTAEDETPPVENSTLPEPREVTAICARHGNDHRRMMDILMDVQDRFRCIPPEALDAVAVATGQSRIHVEGVATFYSFFSKTPKGRITIRLCDDIIDRFAGIP